MTEYIGFKRFVVITVVSVYLLILAGGIVRTTGSGMGCPDWPRCFGKWVPPVKESDLPSDYKLRYTVHGYETEFNPVKTWIEYINRLLGALIGIFVLAAFVLSLRYKIDKVVSKLCGLALFMVILEGIVGKYVVSTNLKPLLISFHLWGSIFVILLLIYVMCRVRKEDLKIEYKGSLKQLKGLSILLIVVTIIQIIIGTQVREQIDAISLLIGFEKRVEWISNLNYFFDIHREFSIFVLLLSLYYTYRLHMLSSSSVLNWCKIGVGVLIGVEMTGGLIMEKFNIPAFIQPLHMLVATMLLGLQFFIWFVFTLNSNTNKMA